MDFHGEVRPAGSVTVRRIDVERLRARVEWLANSIFLAPGTRFWLTVMMQENSEPSVTLQAQTPEGDVKVRLEVSLPSYISDGLLALLHDNEAALETKLKLAIAKTLVNDGNLVGGL